MFTIQSMLGIELPIIQGGMSFISTHRLAAAVSQSGGLGLLATGGFSVEDLRFEIGAMRRLTTRPFGVNLLLSHAHIDELIDLIIDEHIPVVTCGGGNPAPYVPRMLEAGIQVISVVGNIRMAQKSQALGACAVIFEGAEAGGHTGALHTMAMLPAICSSVDIPVIAAGGIYTGRQMAAACVLGAAGVQIGSRLLVAQETPVHDRYKQKLIEASDSASMLVGSLLRSPLRVVANRRAEDLKKRELQGASFQELSHELHDVGDYHDATCDDTALLMAGECLPYLTCIEPVETIVQTMMRECRDTLRAAGIADQSLASK